MNAQHAAREIKAALVAMKTINAAALHKLARDSAKFFKHEPGEDVLAVAIELAGEKSLRVRLVAFLLVLRHPGALAAVNAKALSALARGLDDWSDVDTLMLVSGRAWRGGQVSDAFFRKWARSPNRWLRRAAVVSTVPLNMKSHGGAGDPARTLAMCDLLAEDRDDMVVKAVSWALRTLSARDPAAVRAYLGANRERLASRVVREVSNKLRTGLKNPRRR